MFYKLNGKVLVNTSNVQIDDTYIELELTDEQVVQLNDQYDVEIVGGKHRLTKGDRALSIEFGKIQIKKSEIREELGKISLQRNGMIELGEDTTEVDTQIQSLKDEYATL